MANKTALGRRLGRKPRARPEKNRSSDLDFTGVDPAVRKILSRLVDNESEGRFNANDVPLLVAYGTAVHTYQTADLAIRTGGGLMIKGQRGMVKHPLLAVRSGAARELRALGSELGITPAERARRAAASPMDGQPMMDFLGDGSDPAMRWGEIGGRA